MRFRTLFTLVIVLPLVATGIAIIATMYVNASHRSSEMAEKLLASVTARASQKVQSYSEDAANLVHSLTSLSADSLDLNNSDHLAQQFTGLLRANPGITWISFSDPSGSFTGAYRDAQGRACTNQSHIENGKTVLVEFVIEDNGARTLLHSDPDYGYDPRTRDFYLQAVQKRDLVWLPPYVFYGEKTPGITCAAAIYTPANQLRGVFSADYSLQALSSFARQVVASEHSQVMVFTADQSLIAHSTILVVANGSSANSGKLLKLADVGDPLTQTFQKSLTPEDLNTAQPDVPHLLRFNYSQQPYLACILPVQLKAGPPEFVATLAPLRDFAPTPWEFSGNALLIVAAALVIAAIVALLLAYRVSSPLTTLVNVSERIGKGELDLKVNLGSLHEFNRLAQALDLMLANLRDWVRVRGSLQLAMEIQRNLLPRAVPKIPGFDITGFSCYCDETGGDYYDYILVDRLNPRRFIIALGDVMGHGLPSALLMAGARGILRSAVSSQIAPAALLVRLNSLLYQDTGGTRFMTMLLVSFDLDKNSCTWSSAGHNPPIIYQPGSATFSEPEGGDVPLAITGDVEYGNYQFGPLKGGQIIFIGSDGVWETFDPAGEQYGKDRLKAIIAANAHLPADAIKQALLASLNTFRGSGPPKDDVTFVIIKLIQASPRSLV